MKELAMMESMNNGKPLDMAMNDMKMSMDVIRYYAGWADKIHGETIPAGETKLLFCLFVKHLFT